MRRWAEVLLIVGLVFFAVAVLLQAAGLQQRVTAQTGTDFETLASAVGRVEAWYQLAGYTGAPPAAAASPFWPSVTTSAPLEDTFQTITLPMTNTLHFPYVARNKAGALIERRAVWLTRYDWTSLTQAPAPEKIDEIVANVAGAGFNTVFFQVRAAGDAYYTPGLEPWAARLTASPLVTDTLGQEPGWDPLARMLTLAHAAGVEVHAYVNVYPAWLAPPSATYGQLAPPATDPPQMFDRFTYGPAYSEHPGEYGLGYTWRVYDVDANPMPLTYGHYLWASPGVDQVQDYLVAVVRDILTRYAVDGVHLDLVRYPGPGYSYDPFSNATAGTIMGEVRAQWQRDRVTSLVSRVYTETSSACELQTMCDEVWLSAAVWPYYRDDLGLNTSSGYDDYYQDSKGWLGLGIVDAIAPMLYGGLADTYEVWRVLAEDFLVGADTGHVYLGIGADLDFDAIIQRIEAGRELGAPGHAIFSYGALNARGYWDDLANGPYAIPAVVPPRPQ